MAQASGFDTFTVYFYVSVAQASGLETNDDQLATNRNVRILLICLISKNGNTVRFLFSSKWSLFVQIWGKVNFFIEFFRFWRKHKYRKMRTFFRKFKNTFLQIDSLMKTWQFPRKSIKFACFRVSQQPEIKVNVFSRFLVFWKDVVNSMGFGSRCSTKHTQNICSCV